MQKITLFLLFGILLFACKKESGEGGASVIEGKVYKLHTYESVINEFDSLGYIDTTYKIIDTLYHQLDAGKDVFIIYSDDETDIYDDEFETDYNGRYRFEFLRKGKYTIYTYADSSDVNTTYEYPVFRHIEIKSNNSTNNVADFVIEKNQ